MPRLKSGNEKISRRAWHHCVYSAYSLSVVTSRVWCVFGGGGGGEINWKFKTDNYKLKTGEGKDEFRSVKAEG